MKAWKRRRGATAVEYGLLLALLAIAIIGAVTATGTAVDSLFTQVKNSLPDDRPPAEDDSPETGGTVLPPDPGEEPVTGEAEFDDFPEPEGLLFQHDYLTLDTESCSVTVLVNNTDNVMSNLSVAVTGTMKRCAAGIALPDCSLTSLGARSGCALGLKGTPNMGANWLLTVSWQSYSAQLGFGGPRAIEAEMRDVPGWWGCKAQPDSIDDALVDVTNNSQSTIAIQGLSFGTDNYTLCSWPRADACNGSVAPGETCTISFAPTLQSQEAGGSSDAMRIDTDAGTFYAPVSHIPWNN